MPKLNGEFDYYVAECRGDNTMFYVTDVDYKTRRFQCRAGANAIKLNRKRAEDLLYLMTCNGIPTAMITKVSGSVCPRNPKEQE